MVAGFLHGVETIELDNGPRPIQVPSTAVIGLVGSFPIHDVSEADRTINEPVLLLNDRDAAKRFGTRKSPGYTGPYAIDAWLDGGAGICVAVNIFNPTTDLNTVAASAETFDAQDEIDLGQVNTTVLAIKGTAVRSGIAYVFDGSNIINLGNELTETKTFSGTPGTINLGAASATVVSVKSVDGVTTYALTTDYTVSNGVISRVALGTIPLNASVSVTYSKTTVTAVTDISGTPYISATDYTATGSRITRLGGGTIPVGAMVLVAYTEANFTFVEKVDFTVDVALGKITRLATPTSRVGALASVTVTYEYPDTPDLAVVIGQTAVDGTRSGMQALLDCYSMFGFYPKILEVPGFSHNLAIATEMDILADKFRAMCLVDAPPGVTRDQAINGRGGIGPAPVMQLSSDRVILCYPQTKIFDVATGAERYEPYSQRLAAVICKNDQERGYWWSPSNQAIPGIIGTERLLTARINDPTSDVNILNSVGICTIFNDFGTGYRAWGNRSSVFPTNTHPLNFISIRRTMDVVHEAIERASLQFIDRPINDALIDSIIESVNQLFRTLISRGALIDGRCFWQKAKNPPSEMALGHLTFDLESMPPPPFERATFESFVNLALLRNLGGVSTVKS